MKVSHTMLSTWRRCRYKFYLSYVENLRSVSSPGQSKGKLGHIALGTWYKTKKRDDEKAIKAAWDVYALDLDIKDETVFADTEAALRRYFEWARKKDRWTIITAEYEFNVAIGDGHILMGYIDGVVEYQGQMWLLENKFQKIIDTSSIDLDVQVSTYMIGAYLSGYKPIGVIYNIVRMGDNKKAVEEPVVRKLLYRNPAGLNAKIQEIHDQAEEVQTFLDEGGAIYRNETKDCHWDCPFYSVCLAITDSGEPGNILNNFERREPHGDQEVKE